MAIRPPSLTPSRTLTPAVALAGSLAVALALGLGPATPARAASLQFCAGAPTGSAARQGELLLLAAQVQAAMQASGRQLALVSRSGLDLSRFGQVYSHAGLALRDNPQGPWGVRQLYFACDEGRPRLFDEGLPGFVLGAMAAERPRLSVVWLPPEADALLVRQALDKAAALALLEPRYSANAHAFSTRYQNCNQWVAELMAQAWRPAGDLPDGGSGPRAQAQAWLRQQAYVPVAFEVGPWRGLSLFSPYLHEDDHPAQDVAHGRHRVSMPASLEAWVQRMWPAAERTEWCLREGEVVTHHGWRTLDADCR